MPIDELRPTIPGSPALPDATANDKPIVEPVGDAFVDVLIAGDRDGGGLDAGERKQVLVNLSRLAHDGQGNDAAEQDALRRIQQARSSGAKREVVTIQIQDGEIVLKLRAKKPTTLVVPQPNRPQDGVLIDQPGERVIRGVDPGNFYCEHMFWSTQVAASQPDSSVLLNSNKQKMAGFFHVPSDKWTSAADPAPQEERHVHTRHLIGAALSNWFKEIFSAKPKTPPHILLTGYDTFDWVVNNPTGDFVTHRENVDAAMKHAFGSRLLTAQGTAVMGVEGEGPTTWRYEVRVAGSARKQEVLVSTIRFPVADAAIDGGPRSIQETMRKLMPHAVLSMGVAGEGEYRAEHRADSGGLDRIKDPQHHREGASDEVRLADNYALEDAIKAGILLIG